MIDERLDFISVAEFMTSLSFDSGETIDSYTKIVFYDKDRIEIGVIDHVKNRTATIPFGVFVGNKVKTLKRVPSGFSIVFITGHTIELRRLADGDEYGLISRRDGFEELR